MEIEGRTAGGKNRLFNSSLIAASPDYLPAINVPLLLGRGFNDSDGLPGKETAVVTQEFAARYFKDESPLGRRIRFLNDELKPSETWITIIGVCGNLVHNTQERDAAPLLFISTRQEPWAWLGILLRTRGDPAALTAPVRAAIQEIDPDLPLIRVQTLPEAIERQHWFLRVFGALFFVFAAIALLIASVGLYAVVAQNTARRTREIGIRMALGAEATAVQGMVVSQSLRLTVAGIAIGLAAAFALTRFMQTVLVGLDPSDPPTFTIVTLLLALSGLVAAWVPALRATRVDPVVALRHE
jgi:predicted permease